MGTISTGTFGGLFAFFLFVAFICFVIHIALCVWAYRDSTRKGKSPEFSLLVMIGLFFFPVMGLIVYLIIRNDDTLRRL